MRSYTYVLFLLVIIGVLSIAWIAVRFALQAERFRQVAVICRSNHLRMQGKKPDPKEVEREVLQMAEELERGE